MREPLITAYKTKGFSFVCFDRTYLREQNYSQKRTINFIKQKLFINESARYFFSSKDFIKLKALVYFTIILIIRGSFKGISNNCPLTELLRSS